MIVVVAPCSHPSQETRVTRDEWAKYFTAQLIRANEPAIYPRAHCDALRSHLPLQVETKLEEEHIRTLTLELVRYARQVIAVQFDGWTHDPELHRVLKLAEQLRIPVRFVNPDEPVKELLAA